MELLRVVRPIKVNGEVLQPGEIFKTDSEQVLLDRGYARLLTREEKLSILDGYIREAERVFMTTQPSPIHILPGRTTRSIKAEYPQGRLF